MKGYTLHNTIPEIPNPITSFGPPMDILSEAASTVNSDRQGEYGDPVENWVRTALIATITQGKSITPEDVIQTMCAAKMVRAGRSHKRDTNVDQAGYAEIRERMQKAFADGTVQKIVENLLGGWVKFATVVAPNRQKVLAKATMRPKSRWEGSIYIIDLDFDIAGDSLLAGEFPLSGRKVKIIADND